MSKELYKPRQYPLLKGAGKTGMTGAEAETVLDNNIMLYQDDFGSHRFVYYVIDLSSNKLIPVSVIQVIGYQEPYIIANVYTEYDYRRRGYAKLLLNKAREVLSTVLHSKLEDQTKLGKVWVKSAKEPESISRIRTIYHMQNPAWANRIIEKNLDIIGNAITRTSEMPVFDFDDDDIRRVVAKEYGCGKMGCVFPTFDDNIVFKITSDDSEVRFIIAAMNLGQWPEGMIQYFCVVKLVGEYKKRSIYGIWRENSPNAGVLQNKIEKDLTLTDLERRLNELFNLFFEYGNLVIGFVYDSVSDAELDKYFDAVKSFYPEAQKEVNIIWDDSRLSPSQKSDKLDVLVYPRGRRAPKNATFSEKVSRSKYALASCVRVARMIEDIPEFSTLGHALLFYIQNGILINDLHFGNIGQVYRSDRGKKIWSITDPGIVVFLTSRFDNLFGKYDL